MSVGVNWDSMERIAKNAFLCQGASTEDVMSHLNVFVTKGGMDCFVMSVSKRNTKAIQFLLCMMMMSHFCLGFLWALMHEESVNILNSELKNHSIETF